MIGGWIGSGFPKPSLVEAIIMIVLVLGLSVALHRTYFAQAARTYRRLERAQLERVEE
jgi:hypothetical protein